MEIKITEYVACQQEAFHKIEVLLHIYNVRQTEVFSGFSFTFINHKL